MSLSLVTARYHSDVTRFLKYLSMTGLTKVKTNLHPAILETSGLPLGIIL
jgi:hypothetical protein